MPSNNSYWIMQRNDGSIITWTLAHSEGECWALATAGEHIVWIDGLTPVECSVKPVKRPMPIAYKLHYKLGCQVETYEICLLFDNAIIDIDSVQEHECTGEEAHNIGKVMLEEAKKKRGVESG